MPPHQSVQAMPMGPMGPMVPMGPMALPPMPAPNVHGPRGNLHRKSMVSPMKYGEFL